MHPCRVGDIRWPGQKRRAAGHKRQHVINRRLRVLPTCPEWRRLSRRARDTAATMLHHSRHRGDRQQQLYLELSDRSEIWHALRQYCCRCACQISKRSDNLKYQSRGFETSRDLTIIRLFGYWDGALAAGHISWASTWWQCPRCLR